MRAWSEEELLNLAKARLEGCRKGGRRSGQARREAGRRNLVVRAIQNRMQAGDYDRNSASKIARYLGVSPRYVRIVAADIRKKNGKAA